MNPEFTRRDFAKTGLATSLALAAGAAQRSEAAAADRTSPKIGRENMTAADLLVRQLKAQGVPFVATLCGNGLDPFYAACQWHGMRLIDVRNEQAAGHFTKRLVTVEDVAKFLGFSRPTYIAREKGDRPAKADEIVKLASYFGRKVHELVRPGEPVVDLQPHLRAVAERMKESDRKELLAAIDELQRLAEDYRELERLNNAPLRLNYPREVKLAPRTDVAQLAESVAVQERRRLGLGDQPIIELRRTLEWDVGLRIFYWALPSAVAGMYAYGGDLGCCILVNRRHPPERRRVSMLHEYGHLIVDRYSPGIDYLAASARKPANERFAEAFALSFLMPESSLRERFHDIVATTRDFQVADLCRLCNFYFVSVEAMTLRLEQLALIPKGTWRSMKESKFAPSKAAETLGLEPQPASDHPFPDRYMFLAVQAYEGGEIGDSELAHYFRCDIVTAREIVAKVKTSREVESSGEELQLRLDFQQSLLNGIS